MWILQGESRAEGLSASTFILLEDYVPVSPGGRGHSPHCLQNGRQKHCRQQRKDSSLHGIAYFVVFLALLKYLEKKAGRLRLWQGPKAKEKWTGNGRDAGGRKGQKLELVDKFLMVLM